MMDVLKKELLDLSDYAFGRLTKRLDGLTDDEYLWEPVEGGWTIHRNGDGIYDADWGLIFDEDPPITTIAWRMRHIIDCLTGERCGTILGLEPVPSPLAEGTPGTASAAIEMLDRAGAIWRGYVTDADEDGLGEKMGPSGGPFAEYTRASFVLHIIDELIHHGAEVSLLRDLYRAQQKVDPFVTSLLKADRTAAAADPSRVKATISKHPHLVLRAAAEGRWDAVPFLIELGFPIDGRDGRTPLHHAAADGNLELVRFLVDLGSDLDAIDPIYNSTPLVWAEYFNRTETADYLRSLDRTSTS